MAVSLKENNNLKFRDCLEHHVLQDLVDAGLDKRLDEEGGVRRKVGPQTSTEKSDPCYKIHYLPWGFFGKQGIVIIFTQF
jgi:hypothetical protein